MADATGEPLSTGSAAEPEAEPAAAAGTEEEKEEAAEQPRARGGRAAAGAKGQRVYVGNLSWSTSWQDLKVRAHPHFVLHTRGVLHAPRVAAEHTHCSRR